MENNPLIQRFRERFPEIYQRIHAPIMVAVEKFFESELSARDARVMEIINAHKEPPGNPFDDVDLAVNKKLDDLLTTLKMEQAIEKVDSQIGNAVRRLGER